MQLKLVSLNIEWDRHVPLVKEFLAKEKADVVCLMEVMEQQLDELVPEYRSRVFVPNVLMEGKKMGVAIVSKLPFKETSSFYCDGLEFNYLPNNQEGVGVHRPVVALASLELEGKKVQIGTTHFTWTQGGAVTDQQWQHVETLLKKLAGEELILCGDFNLPRNLPGGNPLYQKIAERFTDNVPKGIRSTVDPELHRANKEQKGRLAWVVDYIWSTPQYRVENVRIECGVSDHCAVVADIV